MRSWSLFCVVSTGLLLIGQVRFSIEVDGVVIDALTKKPIAGVVVDIGGLRARSGGTGQFQIRGLQPGPVLLRADRDGYSRATIDGRRRLDNPGIQLELPKDAAAPIVLKMRPTAAVSGRVYGPDGQPIRNVRVHPYRWTYDDAGRRRLHRVDGTIGLGATAFGIKGGETDDRGEFRLYNVPPGEYSFYFQTTAPVTPLYYPSVDTPENAEVFSVHEGDDIKLQPVFTARGKANLRVLILNETGEVNSTALVELRRPGTIEPVISRSIPITAQATLDFGNLSTGTYEIDASLRMGPGSPFVASGHRIISLGDTDTAVAVTLTRGGRLSGAAIMQLLDRSPRPVVGLRLVLKSDEVLPRTSFELVSGPNGHFSFRLPKGLFRVVGVQGIPPGMCLAEVRSGDTNVLRNGLEINNDKTTDVVAIVSAGVTTLHGTIMDAMGNALSHSTVALIPSDKSRPEQISVATANQNGEFEIRCVSPGNYFTYAWSYVDGAAYRSEEFMKRYEQSGRPIRLRSASNPYITINVLDEEP